MRRIERSGNRRNGAQFIFSLGVGAGRQNGPLPGPTPEAVTASAAHWEDASRPQPQEHVTSQRRFDSSVLALRTADDWMANAVREEKCQPIGIDSPHQRSNAKRLSIRRHEL